MARLLIRSVSLSAKLTETPPPPPAWGKHVSLTEAKHVIAHSSAQVSLSLTRLVIKTNVPETRGRGSHHLLRVLTSQRRRGEGENFPSPVPGQPHTSRNFQRRVTDSSPSLASCCCYCWLSPGKLCPLGIRPPNYIVPCKYL